MAEERLDDLEPHGRRRFFAAGLAKLLSPAAAYLEKRFPAGRRLPLPLLRPPGAMPEPEFLDTCYRCGSCADACPADAIALVRDGHETLIGTPYVDPNRQACVICDELACMKVCPSGALRLVDRLSIRMGLAVVDESVCVRSEGEDCRICIERCPLGETAIRLGGDGRINVVDPGAGGTGCTGCGVCQQHCPTSPIKAIRIRPAPRD